MKITYRTLLCLPFIITACHTTKTEKDNPQEFATHDKQISVYTTADSVNLRLTLTDNLSFFEAQQPLETEISVFVEPSKTFQTFMGIGGAISDASAETFSKLNKETQDELINAYYNKEEGIGYSLMRTTIHSSDFSSESYTYVKEGDSSLSSFSIAHDKQYRIPMIKRALAKAGDNILLYASPWSPPAFMKSNQNMLRGGTLLSEYDQAWGNYFVKFIKAYEARRAVCAVVI
jgi:glucosylceramidase